jgi:transcriptional regulator
MYIPNAFREDDQEKLVAFMQAHSFATLVSVIDGAPFATHLPVVIREEEGNVTIIGHVAKANPHWQALGSGESLMIFQGPHAYISPALYEKQESVPTWNYIAVHAYGTAQLITTEHGFAAMEAMLSDMIKNYEETYHVQWDSLSAKFREGMMRGIVGFTLSVTRLEGKYKLSQNRSHTDQTTVAHALLTSDDQEVAGTGRAMLGTQL